MAPAMRHKFLTRNIITNERLLLLCVCNYYGSLISVFILEKFSNGQMRGTKKNILGAHEVKVPIAYSRFYVACLWLCTFL